MARLPARVKSHPFIRGRLVGSPGAFMLAFYLQTHSIVLPRSITLGARAGSLQAFSLSLKKSVTYSSRRCVQGSRRCVPQPLATTLSAVYIQRNSVFFIFWFRKRRNQRPTDLSLVDLMRKDKGSPMSSSSTL